MYKNVASQKLAVLAWDTAADAPKTGDAANITAYIRKDGGTPAQTNDVNPTEVDATNMPGVYEFDLTQAETNADLIVVFAKSATADVDVDPVSVYTRPTVTEIQTGLSTLDAAGVRTAVGLASANLDTQISGIAAAVWASGTRTLTSFGSLVSDVAAAVWAAGARTLTAISDSSGITTLLSRATETRLAKLDVSGTLAHSDAANTYKADVSGLATQASVDGVDTKVDAVGAVTAKLDDTLEDNAGTFRFTEAALAEAPSGGGGGDATAANQTTIINHLTAIKGATFSEGTDALDAVRAAVDAIDAGAGNESNAPYVYRVPDGDDAPIPGALVSFLDPDSEAVIYARRTNALGLATFYPDPGTYLVRCVKSGFTFSDETVEIVEP